VQDIVTAGNEYLLHRVLRIGGAISGDKLPKSSPKGQRRHLNVCAS